MNIIRSKWLEGDADASLSLQAMKIYNTVIKMGRDFPEQKKLTEKVNERLWKKFVNPDLNVQGIPSDFLDEESKSILETSPTQASANNSIEQV